MIHTISIFHRNTSIRSYLLAIFPHSRAHSFLRPVTISWTKLSRMACIWHFTSIRIHFSSFLGIVYFPFHNELDKICHCDKYLAFYIP